MTGTSLSRWVRLWVEGEEQQNVHSDNCQCSNVIESAIKQIQDENITAIGHYPRDGVIKDNFADMRSVSRLSSGTFTLTSGDTQCSGLESARWEV